LANNSLKLNDKYTILLSLTDNPMQLHYQIRDDKEVVFDKVSGLPTAVSDRTDVMVTIRKYLPEHIELDKVRPKLERIRLELENEKEAKEIERQQQHELELRKKVHHAKKVLQGIDDPILYIGSIIDWLTAGERINTLICFIAGCSQVILKEPISMIAYGESSSGKTHIQKTALSLLPEDYIVMEKKVSPAALFNRAKTDKYFYDGKIIVYGDMGGSKDKENQQESFDLMKELQSDGKLSKPISVKDESNNWVTEDLELVGNPCLWYTTVPTDIDEQESSRAIVITPRTDNREIFNTRGLKLSLKNGKTYSKYEEVVKLAEEVPYMVEFLRRELEDYIIINPYYEVVTGILINSQFYKRDTDKYITLLNAITALNYYHNSKCTLPDGKKALITSRYDVKIFLLLIEPYIESISVNIKPKSAEIYNELCSRVSSTETFADTLKFGDDPDDEWAEGFTTEQYFQKTSLNIGIRSVRNYFSDLRQHKLLKIVGKKGYAPMYDVVEFNINTVYDNIDYDAILENVSYEIGSDIAEIIQNDKEVDIDIHQRHDLIGGTPWKSI
jgi:hypothetical protein